VARPGLVSDSPDSLPVEQVLRARRARQLLLAGHATWVGAITAILRAYDPAGVGLSRDPHEYAPEAESIAERLGDAASAGDAERICVDVFRFWFGAVTGRMHARLTRASQAIWATATADDKTIPR